jgi:endonuclease VIII
VPEGDTIAYAANRIRPVLEGRVPDEIVAPREPRWPQRLAGRAITGVDTRGKHLFIRFEDGLALHSHLGMVGSWTVLGHGRIGRRAWLVLRVGDRRAVEWGGPLLELMTDGRTRFDQRLAALGPDVLAEEFDRDRFLRRLRAEDPGRPIGDALLDQTTIAGIGNIWKAEGCWEACVDPWRPVRGVSDEEVVSIVDGVRPRMMLSAVEGPRTIQPRVYRRTGQPCPRCGTRVLARGQGDGNRTTYWCPVCQR